MDSNGVTWYAGVCIEGRTFGAKLHFALQIKLSSLDMKRGNNTEIRDFALTVGWNSRGFFYIESVVCVW